MGDLDRLRLLASTFAGRVVEVGAAGSGEPSWTDGTTIYVDPDAPTDRQVRTIAVQGSLLAAGSFEADVVRSLGRRRSLADRYLAVEGHRALIANEAVLPPSLWPSIDHQVAAGLATPADSLERARQDRVATAPADFGSIRPRSLLLAAAGDVHAAVPAPTARVRVSTDLEELDEPDDEADEPLGDHLSSPVGGGGAVGRLFQHLLRPVRHRDGGGPPGADAATHRGTARPGAGRRAVVVDAAADGLGGVVVADPGCGATYPEWDVDRRRYRPNWCTVAEVEPPATGPSAPVALPDGASLRRPLARLGISLARCRREREGDEIDLDAAVEARVDALAGAASDDGVYVASLRRRRDLAVLVLLDVSGSAGEPGIAGRTVHQHQQAVAGALTVALHDLGDHVALYGFRSQRGRQAVELLRVKAFDDHLDGSVARRLTGLTPGAYTRLGAAIRHGTAILDERSGTPRRLLVVISDGFAYDHGYEASYGQADARRALLEARRAGIGCLCLSVGTDVAPEALRRVFGSAAHATVPHTDDLPRHIGPLFRRALRSAEAQHRSFQRTERTRERHMIEGRTDGREPETVLRPGR